MSRLTWDLDDKVVAKTTTSMRRGVRQKTMACTDTKSGSQVSKVNSADLYKLG